jgi:hypothetical protein
LENGLLKLIIELPARKEKCEFTLKMLNETVSDLVKCIKSEDKSIEKVLLFNADGIRYAQNTPISVLVTRPFSIRLNDSLIRIEPSKSLQLLNLNNNEEEQSSSLELNAKKELDRIKDLVSKLYLQLNVEHYEQEQEHKILRQLEMLKSEIQPLEKVTF